MTKLLNSRSYSYPNQECCCIDKSLGFAPSNEFQIAQEFFVFCFVSNNVHVVTVMSHERITYKFFLMS